MTALTKQQKEATLRLQAKYEGDPKPVNSSASIGGGQITINVGMECASQLDKRNPTMLPWIWPLLTFSLCEYTQLGC